MHKRWQHVKTTPAVVRGLLIRMVSWLWTRRESRTMLISWLWLSAMIFIVLLSAITRASLPIRAETLFKNGDFKAAAECYARMPAAVYRFNAANAFYHAGEYEQALMLYEQIRTADPELKADIYHNAGNTLIRLKEFARAQDMFRKSLALRYDVQTEANLMHILFAELQDHMLTGRQEGKKRAQDQEDSTSGGSEKRKEGGGSNQQSEAQRQSGAGAQGKKVEREAMLRFSDKGGSRLSSKQYELINQRSVHETKPW